MLYALINYIGVDESAHRRRHINNSSVCLQDNTKRLVSIDKTSSPKLNNYMEGSGSATIK